MDEHRVFSEDHIDEVMDLFDNYDRIWRIAILWQAVVTRYLHAKFTNTDIVLDIQPG